NTTATAGGQATFWAASTGMMPFSYQWQSNGVAISGATNMSYTTPALTTSANLANYTVTISNASGTTNSATAVLTVAPATTGPAVFSASRSADQAHMVVVFSEPVDSVTSLNAANYSVDNGISVSSVAAGSSANQVVLTTSAMNTNGLYHLSIKNV